MEQLHLLKHAITTLESLKVPYVVVGSWGSGIYGEPRFTRDNYNNLRKLTAAIPSLPVTQ